MSLSIGIVGLPNVGKSTLFNALTKKAVAAENFPFCTIDPAVGVVGVPDFRLDKLAVFSQSEKKIPAAVEFVDIAGLVRGAAEGEGLGNQFLSNIREVNAIVMMVRIFEDESVHHVSGTVNPLDDITTIVTELALADLSTVQNRRDRIQGEVKKGSKDAIKEDELLQYLENSLESGERVAQLNFSDDEKKIVDTLHLLTAKPVLYVLNKKADAYNLDEQPDERFDQLMEFLERESAVWVYVDAGVELEVKDLEGEERGEFRKELGATPDSGVDEMIRRSFQLLDLISYFTTDPEETRAWPVTRGSTAPQAGAAIHSDFQEKFIKADVIGWQTLLDAGSKAAARDQGLIRTEGKEYIVQDGDVIEFKI